MGPYCADVLDPRSWGPTSNRITLEVLRVVLVVGLFIIGVQLPKRYLLEHLQGMLVMVIPTMAFGWVVIASKLPYRSMRRHIFVPHVYHLHDSQSS